MADEARAINLERGALWSEAAAGTNAMGTALALVHPLQVFSAEHFVTAVHGWTCSAAPIHDPETGGLVGVMADPPDVPFDERIGCLGMRALGVDRAVVRIGRRKVYLSPRQSELLALLVLSPEGLSADRIAYELYGDFGKPVSVRSEVSRLRAVLGLNFGTRPYRLSPQASADFLTVDALLAADRTADALARYKGRLLPDSEVPTIVEAREALDYSLREAVLASSDSDLLQSWLDCESGRDDVEACRRLARLLPPTDRRRSKVLSRLRRLAGT